MSIDAEDKTQRPIRSFVLRTGRMTPGQKSAMDAHWPSKGLTLADGPLDIVAAFGRDAPTVFEIGFGMGQSLVAMAVAEPDKNFIGVEVHTPGVGRLLSDCAEQGVDNMRVYCDDAVQVLQQCIADNSLQRIQIYFPDPWHKKRHHKRRLIQPLFVQQLRAKLAPGGTLHFATDWENYAEHMMEVMSAAEGFENQLGAGQYAPRPDFRPHTKFEARGERLGHGVWDLLFTRLS